MTDLSPKTKLIIGLLLGLISIPMIVIGIIYLITISITNIWGWMFIGFGLINVILVSSLLVKLSGTTSSRYDAEFEVEIRR